MLKKLTTTVVVLLLTVGVLYAQDAYKKAPIVSITGNEIVQTEGFTVPATRISPRLQKVLTPTADFSFVWTGVITAYDLQSNGTPNEIWADPTTPDNVHIYFMTSTAFPATDRGGVYLFSDDKGATWNDFGKVPNGLQSGFPSVSGLPNGAAVLANHHNHAGGGTRAIVHIDDGAGSGNFTIYDPGLAGGAGPIWPRVLGVDNNTVAVVSSVSGGTGAWTSRLDKGANTWTPYLEYLGDQAETYKLALGEDGTTVGHVYVADDSDTLNVRDVFYRESTDKGATWGPAVKIFDWDIMSADSLGGLRGMDLVMVDNTPHVVFEAAKVTNTGSYFPSAPSKIMYWCPDYNSGVAQVLADSSDVPWNINAIAPAVHVPLCRPTISKSVNDSRKVLFVAFNAASEDTSADGITYFTMYFSMSADNGMTWTAPERFTPKSLGRFDWRFVSVAPYSSFDGDDLYVHMTIQARDTAGILVQEGPAGGKTELVYVKAKVGPFTSINDGLSLTSFDLGQNYPNPFNPVTTIKYTLPESNNVTLKVFDVLGREVATLVNNVQEQGTHSVTFDATDFSSGMYIYKLTAGNNSVSKKMMILK